MNDMVIGRGTNNLNFDPVESLSYEQARDELVEIITHLERGQMSLDESLKFWERGQALAAYCETQLQGIQQRITQALEQHER
ncbi:exodeoxyribonuclease VII small subunit [Corynebacterium sp. HS2168-gen11]|uniref:exodeoxyribonuclease VII small subunit n=1 Tax=Corynebacterium sp. HS2168-gen11 TaxID=2974027 RepID=UPI00216ABBB5|nr:exodeoxyribonuclease VII small subunit [Corynebacterium sp. HS2168-gen11]MCS4534963.1 exodeoxyribonuclease VII small subunit [Corynebacterium sp. HS2168-gen11]